MDWSNLDKVAKLDLMTATTTRKKRSLEARG